MTDVAHSPASYGFGSNSTGFWAGKRVLVTGHTGFKGAWLVLWLHQLGAQVTGLSLPPDTTPSLFHLARIDQLCDSRMADIRNAEGTAGFIAGARPEIVFHLAAQALVRASYASPLETFATNVQGTAHVLNALRSIDSVRAVVAITTDKVYENHGAGYPFRESDPLGGHDPYSASKAAAELVIACYRDAFLAAQGVAVASARAGNVIGGGDWAKDRLLPDAVRAWGSDSPLSIRNPDSIRPWQHVLEPLAGYLRLAEKLWAQPDLADAYNLGPDTHTSASVRDVITLARQTYERGEIEWGAPHKGPHEAATLTLEIAKARSLLGIQPRWSLEDSVRRTMAWYKRQGLGEDAAALCRSDIADFAQAAENPASHFNTSPS